MAVTIYMLCVLTSSACAVLLLREYRRRAGKLLFWSSVSFVGFAVSNALVFTDFVIRPSVDLSIFRAATACVAVLTMLFGFVWTQE